MQVHAHRPHTELGSYPASQSLHVTRTAHLRATPTAAKGVSEPERARTRTRNAASARHDPAQAAHGALPRRGGRPPNPRVASRRAPYGSHGCFRLAQAIFGVVTSYYTFTPFLAEQARQRKAAGGSPEFSRPLPVAQMACRTGASSVDVNGRQPQRVRSHSQAS